MLGSALFCRRTTQQEVKAQSLSGYVFTKSTTDEH